MHIPRIEDGNNFGVSIQENILFDLKAWHYCVESFYDQISRYFPDRAKLVIKAAKYPNLDDYRQNIKEIDEKQFFLLRGTLIQVHNHYASLQDRISKNLEKIRPLSLSWILSSSLSISVCFPELIIQFPTLYTFSLPMNCLQFINLKL